MRGLLRFWGVRNLRVLLPGAEMPQNAAKWGLVFPLKGPVWLQHDSARLQNGLKWGYFGAFCEKSGERGGVGWWGSKGAQKLLRKEEMKWKNTDFSALSSSPREMSGKKGTFGLSPLLKKKMWVLKLALDFFPPQIWGLFWGGEVAVGKMQWGQNQGKIIWKTRRTTAKMLENGARKDGDV